MTTQTTQMTLQNRAPIALPTQSSLNASLTHARPSFSGADLYAKEGSPLAIFGTELTDRLDTVGTLARNALALMGTFDAFDALDERIILDGEIVGGNASTEDKALLREAHAELVKALRESSAIHAQLRMAMAISTVREMWAELERARQEREAIVGELLAHAETRVAFHRVALGHGLMDAGPAPIVS